MLEFARLLNRAVAALEHAATLDRIADAVAPWVQRAVPAGPARDLASGTPTAHPLHPPATAITVGTLSAGTLLAVTGADPASSRRVIGAGMLAALPTAYAGASDWAHTAQAERRVGLVHASANTLALAAYLAAWRALGARRRVRGAGLAAVGWGVLAAGGMLGGHLAYGMGVGVDTTSFQHLDLDWTDVAAEAEVPATGAILVHAAGVPVLLARHGGSIVALADRCTHRGGPLHEGIVADGCVQCPWHGSRFRLGDGSVQAGPAVRPQPVFAVRVGEGRVRISRVEQRSLRSRPVH